jgi:hypothetical protein
LLSVLQLYKETGILIRRFDFTDPQGGKGCCDRMAAVIKGIIRRYVAQKNDCTTSIEFVEAAKTMKYLSIYSSNLIENNDGRTRSWVGVKQFNNIEYNWIPSRNTTQTTDIEVTVRRAFKIGTGRIFRSNKLDMVKSIALLKVPDGKSIGQHENLNWLGERPINLSKCK